MKLGDGFDRKRRRHHHDVGEPHHAGDRNGVAQEHEGKILVERRPDRVVGRVEHDGVAVGGELISAFAAIMPPEPVRFSITNCWPRWSESHSPMMRATMSFGPPAAKPTNQCTGRLGYLSAASAGAAKTDAEEAEQPHQQSDGAHRILPYSFFRISVFDCETPCELQPTIP